MQSWTVTWLEERLDLDAAVDDVGPTGDGRKVALPVETGDDGLGDGGIVEWSRTGSTTDRSERKQAPLRLEMRRRFTEMSRTTIKGKSPPHPSTQI